MTKAEIKIPSNEKGIPVGLLIASFTNQEEYSFVFRLAQEGMEKVPGAESYTLKVIEKEGQGKILLTPVDETAVDIASAVRTEYSHQLSVQ